MDVKETDLVIECSGCTWTTISPELVVCPECGGEMREMEGDGVEVPH
jgi:Zn finger protein HypA/HybF involved in hydrogenase expression